MMVKIQEEFHRNSNFLEGIAASPGLAIGTATVINENSYNIEDIPENSILVIKQAAPDIVLIINKIKAIVTNFGGKTSHISSIARELNIPCVTGTKHATSLIKSGTKVTVNGYIGTITW